MSAPFDSVQPKTDGDELCGVRGESSGLGEGESHGLGVVVSNPPRVGVANLANALTVLRLLMVPLFAGLLAAAGDAHPNLRLVATAVFVAASLTDRVDGEIARRRSIVTDFGKIADPIADKALIGTAMIALSMLGDLAWWVTLLVLVREIGVTGLRFWVIRRGVIAASRGGKVKTVVQAVAIGLYLLPINHFWGTVRWWIMGVAVVITLGTGIDYVARAVRLRRATASHRPGRRSTSDV